MKKTFYYYILACILTSTRIAAQSVELTPIKIGQSGGVSDNILLRNGSSGAPNLVGLRHGGTLANPSATQNGNVLLNISGEGFGTALTSERVGISFVANESWNATNNGTRMDFLTTQNGTTAYGSKMTIQHDGSVGIGTMVPSSKLHISSGSSGVTPFAAQAIFENSSSSYISIVSPESSTTGILFGKPSSNISGSVLYDGTNSLRFRTGGNLNRMSITSAGNVGIGTTSPTAKLDVEGDIVVKKSTLTVAGTYNALNRSGGSSLYLNTVGTITINGIDAGVDGMILYLICGGSTTLILANENAGATAVDRIATHTGANVTITGRGGATLIYEGSGARWRIVGVAQ